MNIFCCSYLTNSLVLYDMLAVSAAYFAALMLRFDMRFSMIPEIYYGPWVKFAPFYAVYCVIIFWAFRLYKSIWRFASVTELQRIKLATAITTVVHVFVITLVMHRMPISYYLVGAILQFFLIVGIRFAYRFVLLLPRVLLGSGEFFILRASGDSMVDAGIDSGDLVVVRRQYKAQPGKIVAALVDNESTLKRLDYDADGERLVLYPENAEKNYPVIRSDKFSIQGVAVQVLKAL